MKNQNKNIYRALLILTFIGLNLLIVSAISQVITYLNTGADKSKMLNLSLKSESVYKPHLLWSDTLNPSRPLEKPTQKRVAQDYLNAWYVREVAFNSGEQKGLEDYYTESARKKIDSLITVNNSANTRIEATTLSHDLKLEFYSADGQLISFTDNNVEEAKRVFKGEELLLEEQSSSTYRVVMLLEDGFWRIRQFVKIPSLKKDSIVQKGIVTKFKDLHQGVNYYPKSSAWDTFGEAFNQDTLSTDFKKIRSLGFNTIRVFVGYKDFGEADVKAEKLVKLKILMDVAHKQKLQVIVTLFDFYGDYSVIDWSNTFMHSRQIVNALKGHPALACYDVKNEPNLDFDSRGEKLVRFWLKSHLAHIKQLDPKTAVTIGWSNLQSAQLLLESVDIVSFHSYQSFESFKTEFKELKSKTSKPLVLQEFGLSTYSGIWNPLGASEQKQADYYSDFLGFAAQNELNYTLWTLYDFNEIPTAVVGRLPWRKAQQKHFGLYKDNGEAKKAVEVVKQYTNAR
ncbi:cellulase family glycosylhydrolase [Leeuwenhoekiella sp. NPDC079379]|uniref:cellulase family glycosylhydrolase n=1 Tax=Leeuwenhoekiella sp. NPDC079379 TaxID=3364122 RepID=UPI0037C8BD17